MIVYQTKYVGNVQDDGQDTWNNDNKKIFDILGLMFFSQAIQIYFTSI